MIIHLEVYFERIKFVFRLEMYLKNGNGQLITCPPRCFIKSCYSEDHLCGLFPEQNLRKYFSKLVKDLQPVLNLDSNDNWLVEVFTY